MWPFTTQLTCQKLVFGLLPAGRANNNYALLFWGRGLFTLFVCQHNICDPNSLNDGTCRDSRFESHKLIYHHHISTNLSITDRNGTAAMCQQPKLTPRTTMVLHRQENGNDESTATMDIGALLVKDHSLIASLSAVKKNKNKSLRKEEEEPRVDSSTASSSPDSSLHSSPTTTISGPVYPPIAVELLLDYATLPRLPACKPLHDSLEQEIGVVAASTDGVGTSNTIKSSSRHVSFENVEIRRYPMILGDNPSCRCGCPVSLG
jgi:hypothetical protein